MKWILWLLFLCNLGGCTKREIKKFYPLSIGNKWVYSIETDTVLLDSIVIIDTMRWSGKKCYKQLWFSDEYKYHIYWDGELREYNEIPSNIASYAVLLKEPIKIDNTWSFVCNGDTFLYKIEEKKIDMKVPAGTFHNCLMVSRKSFATPIEDGIFWFAPKVGMVKCTFPNANISVELLRYKIRV